MTFNRLANRRFNTDIMLHGVTANAGNQLVGLALVIILKIKLHSIVQPHLIVLRTVRDHLRRLQHPLQIANPALVRVLVLLGGVIFKILTEVSVRPRLFTASSASFLTTSLRTRSLLLSSRHHVPLIVLS